MERRAIAKLASQVGGIKLPAHISIKNNVFSAVDDAGNRVPIGATMNCVIVDLNEKMSRIFWGEDAAYDPDSNEPPKCFSDNGLAPSSRALEPQASSCQPDREGKTGCRWSVWGSARSKMSGEPIPACQNGIKLAVMLVKVDKKAWVPAIPKAPGAVFFFRVPPASLGAVASYAKVIQGMGKFQNPWTGEDEPHDLGYMITEVTFKSQGVVQFRAVGYITEKINGVIDNIEDARVDHAIGRDDEPITLLPTAKQHEAIAAEMERVEAQMPALTQPKPQNGSTPKGRGRPRKADAAPAKSASPSFELKENPAFVTTQDVRDHAAEQQQEAKEAAKFGGTPMPVEQENPAFGIADKAPSPPQDVLDQFMNLDLK